MDNNNESRSKQHLHCLGVLGVSLVAMFLDGVSLVDGLCLGLEIVLILGLNVGIAARKIKPIVAAARRPDLAQKFVRQGSSFSAQCVYLFNKAADELTAPWQSGIQVSRHDQF